MKRSVLVSAVVTAVALMGGPIVALRIGVSVKNLPFHASEQTFALLVFILLFGGGALWGILLTRIHGFSNRSEVAIVGSLSFGLGVIGAAYLLGSLERVLVAEHRLRGVPIHVIFTMLFVPATFLVATIGTSAILLVSGNRAGWIRSALLAGLSASFSFLIMDLLLDTLGMRVGGPHAAERATMLTVALLGSAAAALSAGAILGRHLSKGVGDTPPTA